MTTLHADIAGEIKGLEDNSNVTNYILHKVAHAAAGCAAAAAQKEACEAGAIGAAVGEIVADAMPKANGLYYTDEEKAKVLAYGKLISGTVAAYAGYDVNTAAATAETAIKNNAFAIGNNEVKKYLKQLKDTVGGVALGMGAGVGELAYPVQHPQEFMAAIDTLLASDDSLGLLKLSIAMVAQERIADYQMFDQQDDQFGRSMVIGRSTADIALAIDGFVKSPQVVISALKQLKNCGYATVNGIKYLFKSEEATRVTAETLGEYQKAVSESQLSVVKQETGGTLIFHENLLGHTIREHVGKTDSQLLARFELEDIPYSSSFTNLDVAEKSIGDILIMNRDKIQTWLAGKTMKTTLEGSLQYEVGRVIPQGSSVSSSSRNVLVVITRDSLGPQGYRIVTSYPQ